ncbi:MAG: GFA family protein [Chlamydiales bacterium]|nr:GFA family protein [Chlamydiales bacterium]NCF70919.1 GFA family protein [Chlamydiales bacterium]
MPIRYTLSNKPLVKKIYVQPLHPGACHCGTVKFELLLPNGLQDPRRCNCSMCRRRGAIVASVALNEFRLLQGQDCLSCYQFNTKAAEHYFCSNCGIYTHHKRRSNPLQYAVNIACLYGVDPFVLKDVPIYDGHDHHPSDR